MSAGLRKLKLALLQQAVGANKRTNLERAGSLIREAASKGAKLISLPECFNSPYGINYFPEYAEKIPGETSQFLSEIAKECSIYLVGGSIPERDGDKLYNTCTVFGPGGDLLGRYRKMHLFDIDVPGGIKFKESTILSPGNDFLTFDIDCWKIGIGICYDMRFQELGSIYSQKGCQLLLYPGAFNKMTTGPVHWEPIAKGRALDNQCYLAAISPATDEEASYVAWGHTFLVSPWGEVLATTEEKEDIVYGEIDMDYVEKIRKAIPILEQKQLDVYTLPQPKVKQ